MASVLLWPLHWNYDPCGQEGRVAGSAITVFPWLGAPPHMHFDGVTGESAVCEGLGAWAAGITGLLGSSLQGRGIEGLAHRPGEDCCYHAVLTHCLPGVAVEPEGRCSSCVAHLSPVPYPTSFICFGPSGLPGLFPQLRETSGLCHAAPSQSCNLESLSSHQLGPSQDSIHFPSLRDPCPAVSRIW